MKTLIALIFVASLVACGSTSKPPQPTGEWQPINHVQSK